MKKLFFRSLILILSLSLLFVVILSTKGFETNKFNKIIAQKIKENNSKVSLTFERINFKFDIKNLSLYLETKNPNLIYQKISLPINHIKLYLDLISLFKSDTQINKLNVLSDEIEIQQLKKILLKTKPTNMNSLIINKVSSGRVNFDIEIFFKKNQIVDSFIVKGDVKNIRAQIYNDIFIENTNFNFFADTTDILIKAISCKSDGLEVSEGNLQIQNLKEINIKSEFKTKLELNKKNISKYSFLLKQNDNFTLENSLKGNLSHYLQLSFDKTLKIINYDYKNKGNINNLQFKISNSSKNRFLEKKIENLFLNDTYFSSNFNSNKIHKINAKGNYSFDNENYNKFNFENNILNSTDNLVIDFDLSEKVNINVINYTKEKGNLAKIFLDVKKNKKFLNINKFKFSENKSLISVEKLKLKNRNLQSVKKIEAKTFESNLLKNDFIIEIGKKIKISGKKFDAKNLNKLLNQNQKRDGIFKKISKEIDIDLQNIDTPLSTNLSNFKLIGEINNGKFIKISSKGDFGDNKFLDISMKNHKNSKKKYLEIYSDLPQPLLSEYSFFKGLSEGILTYSSIIDEKSSSSKLLIENFKVINAPGLVKLLSLADFGGLADLAEGEGLSFDKMEMKITNSKGLLNLNELYAVGPSISVLMEGYSEETGLTSLKGTLVPAKNLNKILSKIPVIGDIIIPKEVGEGLFGVSFKIKGKPGKLKTTINPIKTITPRFITKALEKSKKSK